MKFSSLFLAESFVNRAFETTGTSFMIVMMEVGTYLVCSRKEAAKLQKDGYEIARPA